MPLSEFLYGSAYYPEHWDAETRKGDPDWMVDAGFNCVRMGEFSWDMFEPEEGKFDFRFHTEVIETLGKRGIKTIFCTPTAAPPVWLTHAHPSVLRADAAGVPLQHGSRQQASHMSSIFREYSRRITSALAEHFRDNPHVIGWQTDNEFHCHFSEDHSAVAVTAFRDFLREKFDERIDLLNQAWGTAFWAQTYRSFDEIPTPKAARPTWINPAHALDYHRFLSHGAFLFQRDQVEILRRANPSWFITHNGCFADIDYRGPFTRDLDFLGFDAYPSFEHDPRQRLFSQAFNLDGVRVYSGNFILLEQQSGPGGQGDYFLDHPEPGEMRRMAWSSVARGADSLLLFRERSCRFGAEEYWCGILDHDNVPRRRFHEARQLGAEFKIAGPELLGTSVEVDIAVMGPDLDSEAGHGALSLGLPSPKKVARGIHKAFLKRGYAVGCIHPADDLSGVSVYFLPHVALFDPDWLPNLQGFVEEGGILVIGARSGSKDLNNNVVPETLPGVLRAFVGAAVEEYSKVNCPEVRPIYFRIGDQEVLAPHWYELLECAPGTEAIGKWTSRHLAGGSAVTLRRHGKGAVVYVGTYLEESVIDALYPVLMELPSWPSTLPGWQEGLEIVCRRKQETLLWFYINHQDTAVEVKNAVAGTDLLLQKPIQGDFLLGPNEVTLIRQETGIKTDR